MYLELNQNVFDDSTDSKRNHSLFKNLLGIIELTKDTLQQKKMNLLGCKMKIYQERMRQIQFLEILSRYKLIHNIDNIC